MVQDLMRKQIGQLFTSLDTEHTDTEDKHGQECLIPALLCKGRGVSVLAAQLPAVHTAV